MLPFPGWTDTAAAGSISLAPVIVDEVVEAGVTHQIVFRVKNPGDGEMSVATQFQDWDYEGDEMLPRPGATTERSAVPFCTVQPPALTVGPGAVGQLELLVTLPPDASGSYFALFGVAGLPADTVANGQAVGILTAVFARIALRVDGTGTDALTIDRVEIDLPSASTPLEITAWARNEGDVHLNLEGRFVVLDEAGAVKAKLEGRQRTSVPGQTVSTNAVWADTLDPGTYTALVSVAYGPGNVATTEERFTVAAE